MPEIAVAVYAVILGHAQVQHHQLISLARMLERKQVSGLDAHLVACAVHAGRPLTWPCPHMSILHSSYGLDHQSRDP
ncbi:hypothetical protein CKA81_01445 [Pollutimonas thiosulfatoxidans]|uniref:Uncharacterized protein n=1 Tax=Pollutimonas thiosulfatoxidans TaxID=2028345 RepID=A0A410G8Q5_9BURK|nr:hypothetical protein CKA81_01445 [Pollutimonas thiosulfatoxidans]